MALAGVRNLIKVTSILNENMLFNARSIMIMNMKRNKTVEESKAPAQEQPPPESPNASEDKVKEEFDKLNKEITNLTESNKELLDKYKRALADGENLRSRLMKQVADTKMFAIQGFCKDLLDVADVLNKATETIPKEEINDKNPHLKNLYEGLVMTEAQLKSVFKRHGLEPVNPLDEKFDPNFHEALFQQEVEGKSSGTVVVVSKIGYKLHDRVIRPALVGVSK